MIYINLYANRSDQIDEIENRCDLTTASGVLFPPENYYHYETKFEKRRRLISMTDLVFL